MHNPMHSIEVKLCLDDAPLASQPSQARGRSRGTLSCWTVRAPGSPARDDPRDTPPNHDPIPVETHQPEQGLYFIPESAFRLIEERLLDTDPAAPKAHAGPQGLADRDVTSLLRPPGATPPRKPAHAKSARKAPPRRSSWVKRVAHRLAAQTNG